MLSYWDNSVYCSPLAEVLSLDSPPPNEGRLDKNDWLSIVDPGQDPAAQLHSSHAASAVQAFVNGLAPRDREVIYRVFWKDERQAEVARRFGLSRMAVTKIVQKISRLGRHRLSEFRNFSLN